MINGAQVRAARALLDWTSRDLAERAGMQPHTVTNFEGGKVRAETETIEKMVRVLEGAGIEFTATGVQTITPTYRFNGPNAYLDVLVDVLMSGHKDVAIQNVDNKKSPPAVIEAFRQLRADDFNIRMTAKEGDTYLILPVSCYRWVPEKYYKNWPIVTYGDRVATKTSGDSGYLVVRDQNLADANRNQFNYVWDLLKPLDIESTAHVHIE